MDKIKINTLVSALFISAFMWTKGWTNSFTDLVSDIQDNTHVTIAQNAIPGYFYNAAAGRSEVGALTSLVNYRFLSADVGYTTGYNDASRVTVVFGGLVHFDKLASQFFPRVAALTNAAFAIAMPSGINELWRKAFIGFYMGHSLTESEFDYGVVTGLAFKFGQ